MALWWDIDMDVSILTTKNRSSSKLFPSCKKNVQQLKLWVRFSLVAIREVYSIQLYVMVSQCLAECPWFSLGNPVSMPWSSLGSPVSIPVVLSGLSDVNTGGSLWVLRCQCRWFSLGNPVSMSVVLSGHSGVNAGGSLWVLRCQYQWFSLDILVSNTK